MTAMGLKVEASWFRSPCHEMLNKMHLLKNLSGKCWHYGPFSKINNKALIDIIIQQEFQHLCKCASKWHSYAPMNLPFSYPDKSICIHSVIMIILIIILSGIVKWFCDVFLQIDIPTFLLEIICGYYCH